MSKKTAVVLSAVIAVIAFLTFYAETFYFAGDHENFKKLPYFYAALVASVYYAVILISFAIYGLLEYPFRSNLPIVLAMMISCIGAGIIIICNIHWLFTIGLPLSNYLWFFLSIPPILLSVLLIYASKKPFEDGRQH